uniref:Putative deoxyribonuclease ii n=1 Tax=Amblyomma tuberculatum TaxID=48802 RepID=A0A6M2E628_9ACAR
MARLAATVSVFFLAALFDIPKVFGQKGKGISCKDATGRPVDWFVLYKLPKTKHVNGYMSLQGGEMAYSDSGTKKIFWTLLSSDIYGQKLNPIKETLAPIFGKKPDPNVAYVAYNDQLPGRFNGTRGGHSKGILMAGANHREGMVWLQHSVPRFVEDVTEGYAYPGSGRENGQLFLCLSMPLKEVNIVAQHLQVQAANLYQYCAPKWAVKYSEFWNILTRNYSRAHKTLKIDILKTARGKPVLAIAKPPNYPKDIYTDELNKQMNDSIVVQSWKNGAGGAQDMLCSRGYSVNDVEVIDVKTKHGNAKFSSKEDHSKWYVTRHKGIFCFSSLNRMLSQKKRGGEITCLYDPSLAELFRKSIAIRSRCKNDKAE